MTQILALDKEAFFPAGRLLANDLLNIRTRIANFGRRQVNEELARQ